MIYFKIVLWLLTCLIIISTSGFTITFGIMISKAMIKTCIDVVKKEGATLISIIGLFTYTIMISGLWLLIIMLLLVMWKIV